MKPSSLRFNAGSGSRFARGAGPRSGRSGVSIRLFKISKDGFAFCMVGQRDSADGNCSSLFRLGQSELRLPRSEGCVTKDDTLTPMATKRHKKRKNIQLL